MQYALFKDPNSHVFGGTSAARCTAAIRLPNNPGWSNSGWWAESVSTQAFGDASPAASPGGALTYASGSVELTGGATPTVHGRASLRDNGNKQSPFDNLDNFRNPQFYSTLMECRSRSGSGSPSCLYFVGFATSANTDASLSGVQRMCGFVCTGNASNWRAVVVRNAEPNDGISPGVKTVDVDLGFNPTGFQNFVLEVSGGGQSARWRSNAGAWTNNKIPIVASAVKSNLLSRQGEGPVLWGAETRETALVPAAPAAIAFSRLSIHAWRPGFVATRPVFRK